MTADASSTGIAASPANLRA